VRNEHKCDRHGHELPGVSPAITLKGGNMQAKARVPEETLRICPRRDKQVKESQ